MAGYDGGSIEKVKQMRQSEELFKMVVDELAFECNPDIVPSQLKMPDGWVVDTASEHCGYIESWGLNKCKLQAIPETMGQLKILGDLDLSYNQLQELPGSFGSIIILGGLKLNDNELAKLPDSLFEATRKLTHLQLQNNQLVALPNCFDGFEVGSDFDASNNKLESIPESFGGIQVNRSSVLNNEY